MLCVCNCKRKVTDEAHFEAFHKEQYCQKCGGKFKLMPQSILGVRIKVEGGDYEDGRWLELVELKKLLDEI